MAKLDHRSLAPERVGANNYCAALRRSAYERQGHLVREGGEALMALDDEVWVGQSVHEARYERDLEEAGGDWLDETFKPLRGRKDAPLMGPFNVRTQGHSADRVLGAPRRRHERRSQASQTADESFNARLAPTYADWLAEPNRYDIPLVDTIPPERIQQRADAYASRALEADVVSRIEEQDEVPGGWGGLYTASDRAVQTIPKDRYSEGQTTPGSNTYGSLLAHEVGHGVDYAAGAKDRERTGEGHGPVSQRAAGDSQVSHADEYLKNLEEGAFDWRDEPDRRSAGEDVRLDRDTLGELWQISQRRRGRSYSDYRRRVKEVVADALAQRETEPRAIRRDYPRAASWLDRVDALAFSDLEDGR